MRSRLSEEDDEGQVKFREPADEHLETLKRVAAQEQHAPSAGAREEPEAPLEPCSPFGVNEALYH